MAEQGEGSNKGSNKADKCQCTPKGDPIDVATGEVFTTARDILFGSPFPIGLYRIWQSKQADIPGIFGLGWTSLADQQLILYADEILFKTDLGNEISLPLVDIDDSFFVSCAGVHITRKQDEIILVPSNGKVLTFRAQPESTVWRVKSICSQSGDGIHLSYENERLSHIRDAAGLRYQCGYDNHNRLSEIYRVSSPFTENIRLRRFRYDAENHLVTVFDEFEKPCRYVYNEKHLLIKETNRNHYSVYYRYDEEGRCIENYGDNRFGYIKFDYHPSQHKTVVTGSNGGKSDYYHNDAGLVTMEVGPTGAIRQSHYNNDNLLTGRIDENENTITYQYDTQGRQILKIDQENNAWKKDYSPEGTIETDPEGNAVTRRYNTRGKLISERDSDGNYRRYRFDAKGRLYPASNNGSHIEYNHWDRPILKRDGNGNETRYEYDVKGRLILEIDATGKHTAYTYDAEGNCIGVRDSLGNEKVFAYEGDSLNTSRRDENGHSIRFSYNDEGNIEAITNENGERHLFEYGPDDRICKTTAFDGQVYEYEKDPAGNIKNIQVPGGRLCISYDRANRLSRIEGTEENGNTCWISYGYDKAGRLIEAANENGSVHFEYDALNHIVKESAKGFVTLREYDSSGNLTAIKDSDGLATTYIYDENGRVKEFNLPNQELVTYVRDAAGFPKERHLPGRTSSYCNHDAAGRLIGQKVICRDQILIKRDYYYDPNGRLSRFTDQRRGSKSFAYDPAGRLAGTINSHDETEQFEYDPAGNLLLKNGKPCATYAEGSRQLSFDRALMDYDPRGNLISKTDKNGTCRYSYNLFDQLIRFTAPDNTTIGFTYDALGRRILKKSARGEVRYHWNLFNLAWEEVNAHKTQYIYYPESFLPLCLINDQEAYYFQTDHLGTPYEIIDNSGQIVWSGDYSTTGSCTINEAASIENNLRFRGQFFDIETGLHYNLFRYYDPQTGRYITQDPKSYLSGDYNSYRYCAGDAVNRYDPLGLTGVEEGAAAVGLWELAGPYIIEIGPEIWQALKTCLAVASIAKSIPKKSKPKEKPCDECGNGNKKATKKRTSEENKKARNKFKNNKEKAKRAWEDREGQDWPVDENGQDWPAHHEPPLKEGGDPMDVIPQDPGGPDPHNIPGPDGLTDYQRWGAEGTPAREANKLK
jgi:RHS repeat-associated protein